ncbi:MAG: hypothetical protein AAFW83_06195 [Pseudomonadota bacterium]
MPGSLFTESSLHLAGAFVSRRDRKAAPSATPFAAPNHDQVSKHRVWWKDDRVAADAGYIKQEKATHTSTTVSPIEAMQAG